jgi:hypothetical protein
MKLIPAQALAQLEEDAPPQRQVVVDPALDPASPPHLSGGGAQRRRGLAPPPALLAGRPAARIPAAAPGFTDVQYWIAQASGLDIVEEPEPEKVQPVIE